MKILYSTLIALCLFAFTTNAQIIAKQDFEAIHTGNDILKLNKGKFNAWGNGTWTVAEEAGKGFDNSNKFASSDGVQNANIVKYVTLEADETYEFSIAVKMTGTDGDNWKGNYTVNIMSGKPKGEKPHKYAVEKIEEPKEGVWKMHKIKIKVQKGEEKIYLQVIRWKTDTTLHIDDFKLRKL